ncbi:MAG: response regulator [Candidatus Hodarchaeales archaeon]
MARKVILFIEDNPDDVEITLRGFKKGGLSNEIIVLRDGQEAIDYINSSDREECPIPGLILLDINLPKIDGIEVLGKMKKHTEFKKVPVIMLTASQKEEDVTDSYELGAMKYLIKPVSFGSFLEIVKLIKMYWFLEIEPPVEKELDD